MTKLNKKGQEINDPDPINFYIRNENPKNEPWTKEYERRFSSMSPGEQIKEVTDQAKKLREFENYKETSEESYDFEVKTSWEKDEFEDKFNKS